MVTWIDGWPPCLSLCLSPVSAIGISVLKWAPGYAHFCAADSKSDDGWRQVQLAQAVLLCARELRMSALGVVAQLVRCALAAFAQLDLADAVRHNQERQKNASRGQKQVQDNANKPNPISSL